MSHVPSERGMSHINLSRDSQSRHVTYEWAKSHMKFHTRMSHVPSARGMSHINGSRDAQSRHVTYE